MKYSTLHKVALTAMALVASLALTAQAGSPSLSSAAGTYGPSKSINPIHGLLFPAETYMLDDGTAENGVGLTEGGDVIALNEFAVTPGNETITSISIAWGTPAFPDPSLNGTPYTVAIWSDPNGDGNPNDAVLLNTAQDVISSSSTDTFITTDIPDTTIMTANFFVGFLITHEGGQFPAAFDETPPTLSNRSYIAGGDSGTGDIMNLNNNALPVAPIESFGLIGNWLIRADAEGGGGGDEIVLTADSRRQLGNRLVALSWTPADGGRMKILRDRVIINTVDDDGFAQDNLGSVTGNTEVHFYQVCEADTGDCSDEVRVKVRGQAGR